MQTLNQRSRVTVALITLLSTFVFNLSLSPAQANTGVQVTLISPKQGVAVNPDLPFVITLAITGGSAATANTCHEYNNPSHLGNLTFGAQAVDVNNLGKQLTWGIPGNDYRRTDGGLVGWSARIIPNGIECSMGVVKAISGSSGVGGFQQGLTDADYAWFGTKQSNWSGSDTNFGAYSYVDFAWKLNGVITHNKFQATSKGMPTVSILGLQRGQVIDYEATFQVVGTMSSSLILQSLYVAVDGSGVERYVDCESGAAILKKDNGDGTTTYSTKCTFLFVNETIDKASLRVSPVMRSNVDLGETPASQTVTINVGKQGEPTCINENRRVEAVTTAANALIITDEKDISALTTAAAAVKIRANLQADLEVLKKVRQELKSAEMQISSCKQNQEKNLVLLEDLVTKMSNLESKVTNFINNPAAQLAAVKAQQEAQKIAAAQSAAMKKKLYNIGYSLVFGWSDYQLRQASILKFLLPGKKYLTTTYARDWCSQLPKVVIGLSNQVGFPPNSNYVSGCAAAAVKIRLR